MTETQERFLRTVLTRVPLDDIVEMHLFPPIRRGTMETGVAVIATLLPPVPLTVIDADDAPVLDADGAADAMVVAADGDAGTEADAALTDDIEHPELAEAAVEDDAVTMQAAGDVPAGDDDSPYADEPSVIADAEAHDDASDEVPGVQIVAEADADGAAVDLPAVPAPRLRILTAMYRHTIKGIDRGKWVVDVQEEADAPLAAVEAVLRGVRQRSTEPADPELVSPDMLAALLEPTRVAPAA